MYSMVDICARNFGSIMLLIFFYIFSQILNAIIYGQFAVLTEELNRNDNVLLEKINNVNEVMAHESVPLVIKSDVREHILQTHTLKGM